MDIFDILTLCGGLAFFLYGMHVMSAGLEKLAGGKLEKTLRRMTSNPFKSMALGAIITIAIQSSSAMTVMLVGLVNSGIMDLYSTVGVMMGSNIGTTVTAWITSTIGIGDDNWVMSLLKPESFAPLVALLGILFIMVSKKTRREDIGNICVGFAVLMYGMVLMSSSVSGLKDSEQFHTLLTAFDNPIVGLLIGTVFTGVIQSSAAAVSILQALSLTGNVTIGMALPIILGANIGTCMTALLSSFGVNKKAKRVVVIHVAIKVIGTVIVMVPVYVLHAIFHFSFVDQPIDPVMIAVIHMVFNIFTTIVLMPFSKMLVKLAENLVKENTKDHPFAFLDERLLSTPSIALAECKNMTIDMAKLAHDTLLLAMKQIEHYSEKEAELVTENENKLDIYEDSLSTYLVKLSGKELSDTDSGKISKLLHSIGDFERLGDHARNILFVAQDIAEKELTFSEQTQQDMAVISAAIAEILEITTDAFCRNDLDLARKVEPLEQVIDGLVAEEKDRHVKRLQAGKCSIEPGFALTDLLNNYERISDHCSNVAVCMIQLKEFSFETHEFLHQFRSEDNPEFVADFERFAGKYTIE